MSVRGKPLCSKERRIINNVTKFFEEEAIAAKPVIPISQSQKRAATATCVSLSTIRRIKVEALSNSEVFSSPEKHRKRSEQQSEMSSSVLHAGTYLSPSIPVDYFEAILHYLESKLNIQTTLLYESRWEGPREDREDPFQSGYLDLAWMSSTVFSRMAKSSSPIELLPISSVHEHLKGEDRPGYYADVIMHKDLEEDTKEFNDLRGCKWAYNCPESLSGHVITLQNLKNMGENSTFFGNILFSGSHLESIKMVIAKKVDAAAVDSNCLTFFCDRNPHLADDVKVLTSWGRLPPYPIVVNSKMTDALKKKITDCLLNMHKDKEGKKKLEEFHVKKFETISLEDIDKQREMIKHTKGLSFGTTYY